MTIGIKGISLADDTHINNAVDDYALVEGDVIVDATLYSQLENAQWTNDDTEINGKRYHRLNAAGAVSHSDNSPQHYRWTDANAWHYFAYAPIKWRILKISGTKAVLLADRMPDTCPFHDKNEAVNWSGSHLRQWLNDEFYTRAFSDEERTAIETTNVKNPANPLYGTAVTCDDAVLPAITVDLEKASLQKTTSVESTDVNN